MMKLPQKQNKLGSYLTVALGAGAATTSAEAATVFYSEGATGTPLVASATGFGRAILFSPSQTAKFAFVNGSTNYFLRGAASGDNMVSLSSFPGVYYHKFGTFDAGAQVGSDNFVLYDTNSDATFDSVARFSFTGSGGGYLMAVSQNMAGLTFATGVSNILNPTVAATPEPAGFLLGGVPALIGAGALLRRRVRPGSGLGLMALGAEGVRARRESAAAA